jgi:hypothetical protein
MIRVLHSAWTAWAIAGVLLAALLTAALVRLMPGSDYAAASERLTAADRSQPPRMQLEGQYPGPLQDTTIQRWRDPVDGTVCYIYLPIAVAHGPGPRGLVQYGAANIGSISCLPPGR